MLRALTEKDPADLGDGVNITTDRGEFNLNHGDIVIAAITSCTNTSNPAVLVAAGLVAGKARKLHCEHQGSRGEFAKGQRN